VAAPADDLIVTDFQAGEMEMLAILPRLKPDRPPYSRRPFTARWVCDS
jgi:hypothetical protein